MKRLTNRGWLLGLLAGGMMWAGGCAETKSGSSTPDNLPVDQAIGQLITLSPFQTCGDLEGYLKEEAKQLIEWSAYGGPRADWGFGTDDLAEGAPTAEPSQPQAGAGDGESSGPGGDSGGEAAPSDGSSGPSEIVGTNVQELGVDEADMVKTDGQYMYVVRASTLLIADVWPPEQAHVVSSTPIRGNPQQMFVQDDVAVVFSTFWEGHYGQPIGLFEGQDGDAPVWLGRNVTAVTVLDVSDRANPVVVRETLAQGSYVNARLVGQTARVVVRTDLSMDYGYGWHGGGWDGPVVSPGIGVTEPAPAEDREWMEGERSDRAWSEEASADRDERDDKADAIFTDEDWQKQYEEQQAAWKAQMLAAIDDATLSALVPQRWEVTNPGADSPEFQAAPLSACTQVFKQSVTGGLGYLTVLTLDLQAPQQQVEAVTLIGRGHLVYASAGSLYIASDVWDNWLSMMPDADEHEDWQFTAVHRFDIGAQGMPAMYTASGKVPGSILNQFSMSEHAGHLRVASTKRTWWDIDGSENFVNVLQVAPQEMPVVGQITGIAPGERIYSARFFGDKGYVVTFRDVDPLFTIDLSQPTQPTIIGELKVPGYSTYIHPLGDSHLLTIGDEVEDMGGWGRIIGMKLEIFDVSNFANPISAHKYIFDSGYYSEALYEHKAFTFNAARGLLAIPVNGYGNTNWGGGGGWGGAEPAPAPEPWEGEGDSDGEGGAHWDDDGQDAPDQEPSDEWGGDSDEWGDEWGGDWWSDYKVGVGLYEIDAIAGIAERGFVDHADLLESGSWWGHQVRRTVMLDDWMYSVGDAGMKVNLLQDLSDVATVPFPVDQGHDWWWGEGDDGGWGGTDGGGPSGSGSSGSSGGADAGEPDQTPPPFEP